ncbi:helix-turn-helix domain-containing protein [Kineococcus gynurae]|uniref:Helix-turn-helix domain-containing protein n=1 Tax=Kineococcus gynurae TaxID=452979 RepID=A0ABV5LVZ3_9ACTN
MEASTRLTDPAAMRALAHPTRLRILAELRSTGPATVGRLSSALDEAPGSISYHLSRLAGIGLVSPDPTLARDSRERWWRAEHELTSFHPVEDRADPERAAASMALRREFARRWAELHERYLDLEPSLDDAWVAAANEGDRSLHLSVEELAELGAELDDLSERWQARSRRGEGREAVVLLTAAFRRP